MPASRNSMTRPGSRWAEQPRRSLESTTSREEQDVRCPEPAARSRRPRPVRSTTKSSPSKRTTGSSTRRGSPSRHDGRKDRRSAARLRGRGHRHRRERLAGLRRRCRRPDHERGVRRGAGPRSWRKSGSQRRRRRPHGDGDRARSGSPRNLSAQRSVRRLRPRGTQRGLRESDDLLPGRTWLRRRQLQRQRRAIAIGHPLVPPARASP